MRRVGDFRFGALGFDRGTKAQRSPKGSRLPAMTPHVELILFKYRLLIPFASRLAIPWGLWDLA